jgi:hypothetical protein
VPEDLRVGAAGVFEGVGEDGQAGGVEVAGGEQAVFVQCTGKPLDGAIASSGKEGLMTGIGRIVASKMSCRRRAITA